MPKVATKISSEVGKGISLKNICEQSWHMYLFRLHKRTYILSSQELTVDFMFLSLVSSID